MRILTGAGEGVERPTCHVCALLQMYICAHSCQSLCTLMPMCKCVFICTHACLWKCALCILGHTCVNILIMCLYVPCVHFCTYAWI